MNEYNAICEECGAFVVATFYGQISQTHIEWHRKLDALIKGENK